MGKYLKHPFGQAVLVLVVAYILLDYGIAYMSPLLGLASDPVPIPNSVLLQYLVTVCVGILLWVSDNETRWAEFKAPMHQVMVDPDLKIARISLMTLVPVLVAFGTFSQVRPSVAAPTTPQYAAKSSSNRWTAPPPMKAPPSRISRQLSRISS